jgi:hypothetical protein
MLTPEYILGHYPDFLRVQDIPQSLAARKSLVQAIDSYLTGFDFIMAEKGDQTDDLISISRIPQYRKEALLFAEQLKDVKKSLLGQQDKMFSAKLSQLVYAGSFYADPPDVRRLLDQDAAYYLLRRVFVPQMTYAVKGLSYVDPAYKELLPPENIDYKWQRQEIYYSDVLAARASLEAVQTSFLSALAYNLNMDVQEVARKLANKEHVSVQEMLAGYPRLGELKDVRYLVSARNSLENSLKDFSEVADYWLAHRDRYRADYVGLTFDDFRANVPRYKTMAQGLGMMQNTLIDPRLEIKGDEFHVNPAEFFVYYKNARGFLPAFDKDNQAIHGTWPDETFGGILPDNKFK